MQLHLPRWPPRSSSGRSLLQTPSALQTSASRSAGPLSVGVKPGHKYDELIRIKSYFKIEIEMNRAWPAAEPTDIPTDRGIARLHSLCEVRRHQEAVRSRDGEFRPCWCGAERRASSSSSSALVAPRQRRHSRRVKRRLIFRLRWLACFGGDLRAPHLDLAEGEPLAAAAPARQAHRHVPPGRPVALQLVDRAIFSSGDPVVPDLATIMTN